jgi:hypothetical protein
MRCPVTLWRSRRKEDVPFTAVLDGLKAVNPHTKYLESWYKVGSRI